MQRTDSLERPDAGKDWRQEKGMTEDEMVRWHHWLNGHEFEQVLGVGDGQGCSCSLARCSPWSCKELDTTEWNELNVKEWGIGSSADLVPPVLLPEQRKDNPYQNYEILLPFPKCGFNCSGSCNSFPQGYWDTLSRARRTFLWSHMVPDGHDPRAETALDSEIEMKDWASQGPGRESWIGSCWQQKQEVKGRLDQKYSRQEPGDFRGYRLPKWHSGTELPANAWDAREAGSSLGWDWTPLEQ